MTREILTLSEYLEEQKALEEEAAEILPLKFDKCSYDEGYIRQSLYVCLDCPSNPAVICYGCSISCHTNHRLEELWLKRGMRCDCPTEKFSSKCELKKEKMGLNNNVYEPKHNYEGLYCWCNSPFTVEESTDPEQIQPTKEIVTEQQIDVKIEEKKEEVVVDEKTSESDLKEPCCEKKESIAVEVTEESKEEDPNLMIQCYFCEDWFHARCIEGLLKLDSFDEFVCKDCVAKHPYMLSFIDNKLICKNQEEIESSLNENSSCKRNAEKEATPCNLFIKNGWRSCLCSCESCSLIYPTFVKAEEPIYEPEIDENRNISSHDAAISLLDKVERSQFNYGFDAFQKLGNHLREYLAPFAESGKIVTSEDVKDFFDKETKRPKLE